MQNIGNKCKIYCFSLHGNIPTVSSCANHEYHPRLPTIIHCHMKFISFFHRFFLFSHVFYVNFAAGIINFKFGLLKQPNGEQRRKEVFVSFRPNNKW